MILEQRRQADHEWKSRPQKVTPGALRAQARLAARTSSCGRSVVSPAVSSVLLTTEQTQTSRGHPRPLIWLGRGVPGVIHMGDARSPAYLAI